MTDLLALSLVAPVTRRASARLTVYDRLGGEPLASWSDSTGKLTNASATYDVSRLVRRQGAAVLANPDGTLSPRVPGDLLHTGAFFRLERSLGSEYRSLGTFVVAGFGASMFGSLTLRGEDPLSLLVQPFGEPEVVAAGTSCEDALRDLWAPVLDPVDGGEGWDLQADGRVLPLRVFLPDEDRLSAVVAMMAAQGLDVYADRLGHPTMRATVDPGDESTVTVVRGFKPGVGGTLMGLERSGARRIYNRVIVESNAPDRVVTRTTLDVTDESSPIHATRIGVQAAPIFRSAEILGQAETTAVARRLLREYSLAVDTVSGEAVPDETLDAGDVVTFDEVISGTEGRYRLERVTHPVVDLNAPMRLEASRVVSLFGDAS